MVDTLGWAGGGSVYRDLQDSRTGGQLSANQLTLVDVAEFTQCSAVP